MSLNIKSKEAERLARDLAKVTGETLTGAITVSLRERLDRLQVGNEIEIEERTAQIRRIGEQASKLWIEPYSSVEHGDLLYDEIGLPR